MDMCRNVSVPGGFKSEYPPESVISKESSKLDELFPGENKEYDVDLEWLSIFLEDCFSSSSTGYHISQGIQIPTTQPTLLQNPTSNPSSKTLETHQRTSLHDLIFPVKARTKRKRTRRTTTSISTSPSSSSSSTLLSGGTHGHVQDLPPHVITSDPPLLHQAYWLADSELIVPKKIKKVEVEDEKVGKEDSLDGGPGQPRRCTHCLAQRTPQWRAGPLGPKTLCNACGVRFKSGRLLPEYRPAKSPTFLSYKHSNSHKKVMEMRMAM